ncbi:NmrA family NAD(P)-binding protein [Sphingomonas sp. CL5.1]|uniref:SDR family oxidoreductase n=1 Tax=Sphingomonas sp. CL5.1 TaxID=2653203 RepID=UPI0015839D46|nr:NmrA family NAD(P)-binding protein [Sphingomonas sp. CL5.1]QKR99318.1 NmrA family NAD(P)-binding protein [Sphingomonas sp. CL5.1]
MAEQRPIFINCAGSRTQRAVIAALRARGASSLRAFGRSLDKTRLHDRGVDTVIEGDLLDIDALSDAMAGSSTVIHVAPALQDKEVAMGQFAIDAARRAGVESFIYISVIHPQIDYLMNHRAKLAVEDCLIGSGLSFTIMRPMHYFQNLDVAAALDTGRVQFTYSVERPLGFVDMADVGEAVAKVAIEPGHDYATYDLCGATALTGLEIAAELSRIAGRVIEPIRLPLERLVDWLAPMLAHDAHSVDWTASAIERLFNYYDRFGLYGNANVLRWLLGREPTSFTQFALREIAGGR